MKIRQIAEELNNQNLEIAITDLKNNIAKIEQTLNIESKKKEQDNKTIEALKNQIEVLKKQLQTKQQNDNKSSVGTNTIINKKPVNVSQ